MVKAQESRKTMQTGVRKIRIDGDVAGQRIDNFLMTALPGVPRSRIYRLLRRGEVRVNGGRVRAEYRLGPGDEVRIPPARVSISGSAPPDEAQQMLDRVIYEDKRLLVLDKPSGVAVHGGSGVSHGAVELLRDSRDDLRRLSLVHRLDRDTSGCLVLAKRKSALRELHEKFRQRVVEKNYLALVAGDWQRGDYLIDAPLITQHRKNRERYVIVSGEGVRARTRVRLSRTFGRFSLLQCQPLTGRTHQIRVHAQYMGHPLVIDQRYGEPQANLEAEELGLSRLFLHAQSISFPDESGNELHFTAPLADDLDQFLARLNGAGH
ncbi:MAG: RluA family pseudouridine synthase [Woeseia sp.]